MRVNVLFYGPLVTLHLHLIFVHSIVYRVDQPMQVKFGVEDDVKSPSTRTHLIPIGEGGGNKNPLNPSKLRPRFSSQG